MSPVVLNPTGRAAEEQVSVATRLPDLDGKTIGLLHSTKVNSDRILDGLAELLEDRYDIQHFVRQIKPTFSRPVPAEMAQEMAEQCDVVLTGIGD